MATKHVCDRCRVALTGPTGVGGGAGGQRGADGAADWAGAGANGLAALCPVYRAVAGVALAGVDGEASRSSGSLFGRTPGRGKQAGASSDRARCLEFVASMSGREVRTQGTRSEEHTS